MTRKRKSIINISLIFCLLLSLVFSSACSKEEQTETIPKATTNTITDGIGREVEIPEHVTRIACLCPESGYILAMLGQGDKIVAVVDGLQRDLILTDMYPQIKNAPLPKVSGAINIEELVRTDPDVVFVKADISNNDAEVEKLNKSHIPFMAIEFNSIKDQQFAIAMVGKVVGMNEKAEKYNKYYNSRIKMISERVAGIPEDQRIRVYHSINEATRTDIKGSLSSEWLNATGALNVALGGEIRNLEGKYFASLEQILLWDPEVILVGNPAVANYILSNKQWAPLQAVINQRVYQLPSGISRWGHPSSPETPLAIMWTAKTIYPDKFVDLDMPNEIRFFYKEFFGLDLSDEVANQILNGGGMRLPKK